ncbi:MAG: type II toxin-antitoxin system RelE/ParE family toxin [Elusimicrobiota bacterium]
MWPIKIHRLVLEEDFKKIDKHNQNIILKTIYKKLSINPEGYGEGLSYDFKGYWKLKISNYRVIYRIEKEKILVLVLKIGLRRDKEVYKEMLSRLNKQ